MAQKLVLLAVALGGATLLGATCSSPYGDETPPAPDASVGTPDAKADSAEQPPPKQPPPPIPPEAGPSAALPPPCDESFDRTKINCTGKSGPVCGSRFEDTPKNGARDGDLITCEGLAGPSCVRHCPVGCMELTFGPDQCDDCTGRANGTYCLRDLRGGDTRTQQLAITCMDGRASHVANCGDGVNGFCETSCTRVSPPPPSPACCNSK